ncbi:MAG: RDD family protein, partial [bacterium]|nr:RDD family protein [bacterium]
MFAGFWKRLLAAVIDAILLSIVYSVISAIFGMGTIFPLLGLIGGDDAMLAGAVASIFVIVLALSFFSLVVSWLYFAIME